MIGVLLMSHGPLAQGMLESSKLFFGDDLLQVRALCLTADDTPEMFDVKLGQAIRELDNGNGVIVLCDLFGGTPCNRCVYMHNDRVRIIAGMNFTVLLEVLGRRLSCRDIEEMDLDEVAETGRKGLVSVSRYFADRADQTDD